MTNKRNFNGGGLHSGLLGTLTKVASICNAEPGTMCVRLCL